MNASPSLRSSALAFIYDHLEDCAVWIRRLTPRQIENIADLLIAWHATVNSSTQILALPEVEKREITRAISLCGWNFNAAAHALGIGRTTLYRKMRDWGYSAANRKTMHQACVLADLAAQNGRNRKGKSGGGVVGQCDDLEQPANGNTASAIQPR